MAFPDSISGMRVYDNETKILSANVIPIKIDSDAVKIIEGETFQDNDDSLTKTIIDLKTKDNELINDITFLQNSDVEQTSKINSLSILSQWEGL